MGRPLSDRFITALQVWLGFLSTFEAVVIYKLSTGVKLNRASPLFSHDHGEDFNSLFILMIAMLTSSRLSCMWDPLSPTAWRTNAMMHVLEAMYFVQQAFFSESTLPSRLSVWRMGRHAEASLIFGGILFNALLFPAIAVHLRRAEAAWNAAQAARIAAAKAK